MASEFAMADLTAGQLNALVKKLGGSKTVREILSGAAKVTVNVLSHVVDGNADPFLPDGWKVEEHQRQNEMKITRDGDNLFVNGKKIELYLSAGQQNGKAIEGNKLSKELKDKSVLNANILDYLRDHPELIPESWKQDVSGNTHYIFFWGTIYRDSDGYLCVRCLYWFGGGWCWGSIWLGDDWHCSLPAAVLAS